MASRVESCERFHREQVTHGRHWYRDHQHDPGGRGRARQPAAAPDAPSDAGRIERVLRAIATGRVAAAWFLLAAGVYILSNAERPDFYDHFVWQAHAFLSGRAEIEWPVSTGPHQNAYFQDVLPIPGTWRTGRT